MGDARGGGRRREEEAPEAMTSTYTSAQPVNRQVDDS
jgi:hypothetical protein